MTSPKKIRTYRLHSDALKFFRGDTCMVCLFFIIFLVGCGGGGKCNEPPPRTFTIDQISAMTAIEIDKVTDEEIIGMGVNFKLLSNNVLSKLKIGTVHFNPFCPGHKSQIAAIQASQIEVLTPAQVRYLGSSDNGISKIEFLNDEAWMKLIENPSQVTAITVNEMSTIPSVRFKTFGANIKSVLNNLTH